MRNIFNVLIWNFNTQTIEEYNVIPYFVREWKEEKDKSKFKSFDDIKEFVRSKSLYQFWSRWEQQVREEILTAYPDIDIDTLDKVLEIVLI